MSNGRRYEAKRKLNMKKVLGVIIGVAVIIMSIFSIKMLLEPNSKQDNSFKIAYFSAYQDGKWGVIDQDGNQILSFDYDEMIIVPDSSKDIFITMMDVNLNEGTYKTKILNKNKEELFTEYELIEAIDNYNEAQNLWFEENVLRVKKDGKYGLINFAGKLILDCNYDEIVSLKGTENSLLIKKDGKTGLASNVGDVIVPAEYKEIKSFGDNYANGYIVINENGKQGLIGSNKKIILPIEYDEIKPVSGNNLYVVKKDGILKIINTSQETVLESQFDDVLAIQKEDFILKRGDTVGVTNISGEEKIPFIYQELKNINDNYYIAKKEEKYGVIDKNNKTVVDFQYLFIGQRQDTNFIEAEKDNAQTDIYNSNMELEITGIVSEVNTEKGYISIRIDEEQKYYNFKFEEKQEKDFFPNNTLFLSKKDGKYGYKDKNGNLIVDYIYDDAKPQNNYGYCSVKKGNVWGCLNKDGNIVLEPSINLDSNLVIDFIGKWHLSEDLNLYYYETGN